MLGDLTAEKTSLNGNTRLRFFMSIKNKDYMYHLYNIFISYIKTPPKVVQRTTVNMLTNLLQTDIRCSTLRYSLFN
jgi:LAGLIDADG DNA endonuclease family